MDSEYKLIDVFAGMGCASLGFRKAGFEVAAALEIDHARCGVYESNIGLRPINADVMRVSGADFRKAGGLKKRDKICMVGCPPCQSFSKLADTTGVDTLRDPRSRYVKKLGDLVAEIGPEAAVFENVSWMSDGPGRKFFDAYVSRLGSAGYETVHATVNAADYGVPQNRRRVVAISLKKKHATGASVGRLRRFLRRRQGKKATVRDAIGDLKALRAGAVDSSDALHFGRAHAPRTMEIIRSVPRDGGSRKQIPRRLWLACHKRLGSGAESSYGRMSWGGQAPTITCRCTNPSSGRFLHPTQNRGISVREAMRLQTIPDDFRMSGSRALDEKMIGDAVPVNLARMIAAALAEALP